MEMKLEDDLAEKHVLMLDSDKVPGLEEQWAPVKGSYQDHGMMYGVGKLLHPKTCRIAAAIGDISISGGGAHARKST